MFVIVRLSFPSSNPEWHLNASSEEIDKWISGEFLNSCSRVRIIYSLFYLDLSINICS